MDRICFSGAVKQDRSVSAYVTQELALLHKLCFPAATVEAGLTPAWISSLLFYYSPEDHDIHWKT